MSGLLQLHRFHHIGVMTEKPDEARDFYLAAGYVVDWSGQDPLQNVQIVLLKQPGHPMIELIHPLSAQSPVSRLLESRGAGPYHTCYEVNDIDEASRSLRKLKMVPTTAKTPAIAFNNRHVQFFYSASIGLIELLEAELTLKTTSLPPSAT